MPGRRFGAFTTDDPPERPADPAVRRANFRRIVRLFGVAGARNAGLVRGAYHFALPNERGFPGDLAPAIFKEAVTKTATQFPNVRRAVVCLDGDLNFDDESGAPPGLLPECGARHKLSPGWSLRNPGAGSATRGAVA